MKRVLAFSVALLCCGVSSPTPTTSTASLDQMLAHKRFADLDAALRSTTLDPVDAAYFGGAAANADGRVEQSIALLAPLVQHLNELTEPRAKLALEMLGDDYAKSYEYAQAATTDDLLVSQYKTSLTNAELHEIQTDREQWRILAGVPPQTTRIDAPFAVTLHRDRLGLREANLEINGVEGSWIVDTGAGLSVMTESEARRVGVAELPGTSSVQSIVGNDVSVHLGTISNLRIGNAFVQHAVVLIMRDQDLAIPQVHVQMNGILGFPVLRSLGNIVFTHDGKFLVGEVPSGPVAEAPMYLDQFKPVVAARIEGVDQLCSIDTGASKTIMTSSYYAVHAAQYKDARRSQLHVGGAGASRDIPVVIAPALRFAFGDPAAFVRSVTMHDIRIITDPVAFGPDDDYCANIGNDLFSALDAYGFDFVHMRFIAQ